MRDTIEDMGLSPDGYARVPDSDPNLPRGYPRLGGNTLSLIPKKRPPRMVASPLDEYGMPLPRAADFRDQQKRDAVAEYNALREKMGKSASEVDPNQERAQAALDQMWPGLHGQEAMDLSERAWNVPQGSVGLSFEPSTNFKDYGHGLHELGRYRDTDQTVHMNEKYSPDHGAATILHEIHHAADWNEDPGFFTDGRFYTDPKMDQSKQDKYGQQVNHFANGFGDRGMAESLEAQNIRQKYDVPYPGWLLQKYPQLDQADQSSRPLMPANPWRLNK